MTRKQLVGGRESEDELIAMSARAPIPEWLMLRTAEHFAVLALSRRVVLVEQLANGPRSPKELAEDLELKQQAVSKNLRALQTLGVVRRRRDGGRVLYELADREILAILDGIARRVVGLREDARHAAQTLDPSET